MALPGYSWTPVVVQGLNQNYLKAEPQPVKQTPQNNPILFKECGPLVWSWWELLILFISRGTVLLSGLAASGERWMFGSVLWEHKNHILVGIFYILRSTPKEKAGHKNHPTGFELSLQLTDEEPHSASIILEFFFKWRDNYLFLLGAENAEHVRCYVQCFRGLALKVP